MSWLFDDNKPIYLQIIETIKCSIASGKYSAGEKLPSVRDLALEAGVNPNTMQRALSELERAGFLYSQRTAGRFITDDKTKINNALEDLAYSHIETMVSNVTALGCKRENIPSMVEEFISKNNISKN